MKSLRIEKYFNDYVIFYAFLIPWGNAIQNIGISMFLIFWLIDIISKKRVARENITTFLIFSFYYILIFISGFYSNNLPNAVDLIYRLSPLLFFPMVFLLRKNIKIQLSDVVKAIYSFSLSVSIVVIINFIFLLAENNFEFHSILELPGKVFAKGIVNYHYLYLAYYLSVCVVLLLYLLVFHKYNSRYIKIYSIAVILLQVIYLFLLGSRISLFVVFAIASLIYFIWFIKTRNRKSLIVFFAIVGVLALGVFYFDLPIIRKVKEAINYKGQYADFKKVWGGRMMREEIWSCCLTLISERPWTGYGPGATQEYIDKCLEITSKRPILYLGSYKFNAHNQYFQIALTSGIFALLAFFCFIFYTLVIAIRNGNFLYVVFLLTSCLTFLTESILQRNKGIIFFAFFSCFLYLSNFTNNKKKNGNFEREIELDIK